MPSHARLARPYHPGAPIPPSALPREPVPPRLITLGRLALSERGGGTSLSADSAKLLALLAYLAARPGRRATREHLIDLFWADSPVEKARNSLRQALHKLRGVLGEDLFADNTTGDIVLRATVTTDRDAFLAALDVGDLDAALAHYTGPFAPGIVSAGSAEFEHWADGERERLHDHFAGAAETVAQRLIARGEPRAARELAQRLLDVAPLDERAWRLRLEAEMAAGSRIHIAASIAELQRQLAEEDRQPELRTRQLIERLTRSESALDSDGNATLVADLVGREVEFGRLYRGWRSATARHAAHVHITAAAGVGKSRLLEDFAFRLEAERARVARVRATPRQRNVTGSVLATLVSALVDLPGAAGITDRSARILVDLQPAVAARFVNASPIEATDADERRRMRTDAVVDLVVALVEEAPLCLLLDDMHWWDSYSRDVVSDVIERMVGKALLVVTASRPGTGAVSTSISSAAVTLSPLFTEQIAALLTSLGDADDPTQLTRLAAGLQTATQGVPLLVIEAVRLGLDRGLLCLNEGHWAFGQLEEYLASLRPGGALAERVAALTPSQLYLLLLVAVIEQPVDEGAATAIGFDAPGTAFIELERLGMLAPQGDGWIAAHDLIAQVAMEMAAPEALRHAHRGAGVLLFTSAETRAQFVDAIRHVVDCGDLPNLGDYCAEWVRRARGGGDKRAGAAIVRELLGQHADAPTVTAAIRLLPPSLRRRPWRERLTWPAVAAVALMAIGMGWWKATASPAPDATFGIFTGSSTNPVQLAVPLSTGHWTGTHADLRALPAARAVGHFPGHTDGLDGRIAAAPDGRRWLLTRTDGGEFGPTELYLIDSAGVERAIAPAHGDDVQPDWSPDGRSAVFSTTRWAPRDDANFDLAILDVTTRAVRRLTSNKSSDESPHWSPDGTRIAYLRRPTTLTPDELCWISIDGGRGRCVQVVEGLREVVGWLDPRSVLAVIGTVEGAGLINVAIDGTARTQIRSGTIREARLSADATWLLCGCSVPEAPDAPARIIVFPVQQAQAYRPSAVAGTGWFWHSGPRRAWLAQLRVVAPRDSIALDASYRMAAHGIASDGAELDPADGVIVWRSSDPSVAAVDSVTGDLHPHHPGSTWISASAGGWRQDSVRISTTGLAAANISHEDWNAGWRDRWIVYGPEPLPQVVSSAAIGRGFTPNGNGTYGDGAYTRATYPAKDGLGVEALMETRVTRSKWQRVGIAIGRVDGLEPETVASGCGTSYPLGEGWSNLHLMGGAGAAIRVPDELATGKAYRLLVQLFADGTCGVAINGRPVARSRVPILTDKPLAISVRGQSVGTRMLVGPMTVWRGVRGGVDWSALDRDTTNVPGARKTRSP